MKDITFLQITKTSTPNYYTTTIDLLDELNYGSNGMALLIQLCLKWLLQSPGSDVISPYLGGDILGLIGKTPGDEDEVRQAVAMGIMATEKQIKQYQAGKGYPSSEMLASLVLNPDYGISYLPDDLAWRIVVNISSMSGEKMSLPVNIGV